MKIDFIEIEGVSISEVISDKILITETQDALDIMANCTYNGSWSIIMYEKNFTPKFFDLKTGIAGDILQKFSTYNVKLALIGDYSKFTSKSLMDFILESNKLGRINFVKSREEALFKLSKIN